MSGRLAFIVIAAIANFGLGAFVYLKHSRNEINRYFAFFSFAVAVWTLSNGLVSTYAASEWGYVWARFAFASASLIPITFLWFSDVLFPSASPPHQRSLRRGGVLLRRILYPANGAQHCLRQQLAPGDLRPSSLAVRHIPCLLLLR